MHKKSLKRHGFVALHHACHHQRHLFQGPPTLPSLRRELQGAYSLLYAVLFGLEPLLEALQPSLRGGGPE